MKYLLDVSVLVALLMKRHDQNRRVWSWLDDVTQTALCPISEIGWMRVATSPTYGFDMATAREVLGAFRRDAGFIPCDCSVLEDSEAPSWKETTDWYLANLADRHGLLLATLDEGINHPVARLIPSE